jgi:hypothetical protein
VKTAIRSSSRSELTLALALLVSACATVPHAPPVPQAPSRGVAIVFPENQPSRPMVQLRVGQSVGWFLLDTGAAGHVMSDWFFHAAFPERALVGKRTFAIDFGGVPIPTTSVPQLTVTWDDGQVTPLEFAVGPFSKPGDADGMAGIISPQKLFEGGGTVELDFPGRALRWWSAPPTRGVSYAIADGSLQACRAGGRGAVVYAWAAGVEGESVWAMMDTGSPITAIAPDSSPGRRLWPRSRPVSSGRGVSHAPIETRAVGARMDFGAVPWVGDIALMKLPLVDCGISALLGMNVLRRCSIVLSQDRGTVLCSPGP